jgi:hypothetical protein
VIYGLNILHFLSKSPNIAVNLAVHLNFLIFLIRVGGEKMGNDYDMVESPPRTFSLIDCPFYTFISHKYKVDFKKVKGGRPEILFN